MTSTCLLIGPSGELYTKSASTRRWFRRRLLRSLRAALARHAPDAKAHDNTRRMLVTGDDLEAAGEVAARTFGVHEVALAHEFDERPMDDLLEAVTRLATPWVAGRTFAVRVRKRGRQAWSTQEVQRDLGSRLLGVSAGVNLDNPEVTVRIEAFGDRAYLIERTWPGPGGLPLGTQDRCLALLSGGFDSPVAAWMLMRRGAPCDFVHYRLGDCGDTEHALVVAHDLVRDWAAGSRPLVWVLDFEPVRRAVLRSVPSRLRQVVLKEVMVAAADAVADVYGHTALVTGEAIGQVSSQTLRHLAAIDLACRRSVLRPLLGLDKQEIIDRSREIGTHDLSARTREVCNLADGPVAVAALPAELDAARAGLPVDLVDRVVASRSVVSLDVWVPGMPGVPVAASVPPGAAVVRADEAPARVVRRIPPDGPLVLTGRVAAHVGTLLQAAGRDVAVLDPATAAA